MMKMEHKSCYFFAVLLVLLMSLFIELCLLLLLVSIHDVVTTSFVTATALGIMLEKTLNTCKFLHLKG